MLLAAVAFDVGVPPICPQHVRGDAIDDEQGKQQTEGNRDNYRHVELLTHNCIHRNGK
jgi:hypothetical protein